MFSKVIKQKYNKFLLIIPIKELKKLISSFLTMFVIIFNYLAFFFYFLLKLNGFLLNNQLVFFFNFLPS